VGAARPRALDSPEDPARYSFARFTLDLKAVLDHLRLRTAHVGGLSLGAGNRDALRAGLPARIALAARHQLVVGGGLPLSVDNM